MQSFDVINQAPRRILFGPGVSARLADLARGMGSRKPLLVTDDGLFRTGIPGALHARLAAAGLACEVYHDLVGEPSEAVADAAIARFRADDFDLVIGVGGGSALDTAKAVAALGRGNLSVAQVYGKDTISERKVPLILIPTTAGTGSEATPNALFIDANRTKQAVISPYLLPDVALLDPDLTSKLSPDITAYTGMDALSHCVESWLSLNGNPLSESYAYEGIRLIADSLVAAVVNGADIEARGNMLMGSLLGGMALTIAGTAAIHALSYPLGKRGVPHGIANGLLMPRVLRFNLPEAEERLADLAPAFGLDGLTRGDRAVAVVRFVEELVLRLPVPKRLGEVGIYAGEIPAMASESILNQRLLRNNPRPVDQVTAEMIYRECLKNMDEISRNGGWTS